MAAIRYNIVIEQGSDYELSWQVVDVDGEPQDVDGWSADMQVRSSADATEVLVDLAGRLTLGESSVSLSLPGNVSSDFTWRHGLYDLELTEPSGAVHRVSQGRFVVNPEITR